MKNDSSDFKSEPLISWKLVEKISGKYWTYLQHIAFILSPSLACAAELITKYYCPPDTSCFSPLFSILIDSWVLLHFLFCPLSSLSSEWPCASSTRTLHFLTLFALSCLSLLLPPSACHVPLRIPFDEQLASACFCISVYLLAAESMD